MNRICSPRRLPFRRSARRGGVVVYVAVSTSLMLGVAALVIDIGVISTGRTEAQVSADAAALAGAWRLLDQDRLKGTTQLNQIIAATRAEAMSLGSRNLVLNHAPTVDLNTANTATGDIVIGYLATGAANMTYADASKFNSVHVWVRKDETRNGLIDLMFARVFGRETSHTGASATATFQDGIVGFKVTARSGNAGILPLALHRLSWLNLLSGATTTGDNYAYNSDTGEVTNGPDGIPELNLYPGAGSGQLPPGNFGTVDIGNPNNSTADITRQIRYGINANDLSYFPGGELKLGNDGTLSLNGDTGLSAAIKDDLEAIKGQPRTIPIFTQVSGNGNNSHFTVVGFVGIRIMNVRLTGAMKSKQVIIQPAFAVDPTAIAGNNPNSYYVYRPVMLTR